ncbi:NIF family HAD-type phosphatase [Cellulophaga baltica]|uniref:NIF family HAD-type phosphatase n=1 Tax=Cellulophaga baltica TaxID=76594 RepID=UPI0015F6C716|nr:HAD family hydrolase [Cellulophaga baltica]MBA6316905.1 HAD family hydrolase [Cellulophaga baltica]
MEIENKILLILDLDETLIHATQRKLDIDFDFQYADYFIYRRPNLEWFLKSMSVDFKLAVWSSADDKYVEEIVERIKPSSIDFEFVWGRTRCTTKRDYELDEYVHEKRLKKVKKQGFSIERILMVDDSPEKTKDNYGNAIYVTAFEGKQNDTELKNLAEYLNSIKSSSNVRSFEKRKWRNNKTV